MNITLEDVSQIAGDLSKSKDLASEVVAGSDGDIWNILFTLLDSIQEVPSYITDPGYKRIFKSALSHIPVMSDINAMRGVYEKVKYEQPIELEDYIAT